MKQGIETLERLASEVMRQKSSKRDFLMETSTIQMDAMPKIILPGMGSFEGNSVFHEQVATKTGIPKKYYDLMLGQAPDLLARNVNHWFKTNSEQRMIRVLDGKARAMLSSKFRPLDNWMVLEAMLKALGSTNFKLESAQITERKMYVQIIFPEMAESVNISKEQLKKVTGFKGRDSWLEVLCPGIIISNSEVGCGAVNVESLIWTEKCTNGTIFSVSMRKYHVGKDLGGDDDSNREIFSDATKNQADKLFAMRMHDVMKAACSPEVFKANVEKISQAASRLMGENIPKNVEAVTELFDLREDEEAVVLNHLIKGGDFTQWGLSSAVTRSAQDVEGYDRAVDLERIGGKIIEMAPKDWESLVSQN